MLTTTSTVHARFLPFRTGEDSVRYARFRAWMVRQHAKGNTICHLLKGTTGFTVFMMTPAAFLYFDPPSTSAQ